MSTLEPLHFALLTQAEAERIAVSENLTLLIHQKPCSTGFRGVSYQQNATGTRDRPYHAAVPKPPGGFRLDETAVGGRRQIKLGYFRTAPAAALAIARFLGPEDSASTAIDARDHSGWLTSTKKALDNAWRHSRPIADTHFGPRKKRQTDDIDASDDELNDPNFEPNMSQTDDDDDDAAFRSGPSRKPATPKKKRARSHAQQAIVVDARAVEAVDDEEAVQWVNAEVVV